MFCAQCGAAISEGGAFCAKCGAPARPALSPDGRPRRPGIVTLLAVLQFIGASIWLLVGTFGLVLTLADTRAQRDPTALIIMVMMLSVGVLQLACGIGLWKLKGYGRRLQIFWACIGLLGIPLGTIISIVILIYMHKPGVRLLFSEKPVDTYTPEELALLASATRSSGVTTVLVAVVGLLLVVFVIGVIAAIAIPGLLRARIAGNEAATIESLRRLATAERAYALSNRGLYDRPDCLARPADCVSGYAGSAFVLEIPDVQSGYRFTFYPGAAPSTMPPAASRSSLTSFVVMAVPVASATGTRLFCVDQTGLVREARPEAELIKPGSSCVPAWPAAH